MADADHLKRLLEDEIDEWNAWWANAPSVRPALDRADLADMDLARANLASENLRAANLSKAGSRSTSS